MSVSASTKGRGLTSLTLICTLPTDAAQFGAGQFGTGRFGPAINAGLAISVQVNWNGDGSTYVEEAANVLDVTTSRGRSRLNDVFGAGTATVKLRNGDGRYSPNNVLSPLYPNVVVGRAVKIAVVYQGISYPQFAGTIMDPAQAVQPAYSELTLSCIDAFERFRLAIAAADLQQSKRTDQIIAAILTANSWTGGETLDSGVTLPSYAQPNTNVLQALQDAAKNEIGGQVFIGKDGSVVFQNRSHRANAGIYATIQSNTFTHIDNSARQSDLYGQVTATYATYTWSAAGTSAYSGQMGRALYPGVNTVTDFYNAVAVQNVITPLASTDYTVIDQSQPPVFPPSGTGVQPARAVDVTRNVGVQTFTTTGTSFTATLYNALPYTVWLQTFGIRATVAQAQSNPRLRKVMAPGVPLSANQALADTFSWSQDDDGVSAWAMQRAATLSKQHPRPVLTLTGKTAALTHLILGADLSTRIVVNDTTGGQAQLSGLQDQFYLENIALHVQQGGLVTATWQVFDRYQGRY